MNLDCDKDVDVLKSIEKCFETIELPVESRSKEQIKAILDMAVIYLKGNNYRETAKDIILTYKNIDIDVEFPL